MSIANVANLILSTYDALETDTAEERTVNAELTEHLREWLRSSERELTSESKYCIDRFVESELDYKSVGSRGLGRMTDYWTRFGAKHRACLASLNTASLTQLEIAFGNHLLCGYLFAEYLFECESGQKVPRDRFPDGSEGVFKRWIPLIYSHLGPPAFDQAFAKKEGQAYYHLKSIWRQSTGEPINYSFRRCGISVDDFADLVIRQYFDAGVMLRLTEMERISDEQYYNITTAGGYSLQRSSSASASKSSGCLILLSVIAAGSVAYAASFFS